MNVGSTTPVISTMSTAGNHDPLPGQYHLQMDQSGHFRIFRQKLEPHSFNFSASEARDILKDYRERLFTIYEPKTIALLCLYIPVFCIALCGNILVIFVVVKNPHMRRVKNLFLVNLAIADLCVTLICIPMAVSTTLYKLWVYGIAMCKLTAFLQGVAVASSILTLTALSVDRYFAIKSPTSCGRLTTKAQAFKVIIGIWILAGLLIGPMLYVKTVHREYFHFFPPFDFCVEKWPRNVDRKAYSIFYMVSVYAIPAVIVAICYGLIGRTLCSDEFHRKTSDSSSTVMLGRKRVARMLIALIIVFLVCWLPYNIASLGFDLTLDNNDMKILPYALWLGHAHSAINPILYWLLNKSYRHAMKRALHCKCSAMQLNERNCKAQYV